MDATSQIQSILILNEPIKSAKLIEKQEKEIYSVWPQDKKEDCLCPTPRTQEKFPAKGATGQRPGLEKSNSWILE